MTTFLQHMHDWPSLLALVAQMRVWKVTDACAVTSVMLSQNSASGKELAHMLQPDTRGCSGGEARG